MYAEGEVMQTAFVVRDIRAAMAAFTRDLGAGPWFWRERGVFPRQRLHGVPVTTALSIAMAWQGGMLYELIEVLDRDATDGGPTVYDAVLAQGGGFHHFGVATFDYAAACAVQAGRGHALVYEAEVANGARVAYFDTHGALPGMIEVIECVPGALAMFGRFRDAHRGWDGSDPVRPLAPVGS
jgi:hypothetical protein